MSLKERFEGLKKSQDPDEINDFLIDLGKDPNVDHLSYLEFFIKALDPQLKRKVNLNLIWYLGEIASLSEITQFFIDYLYDVFYSCDRWVRNEIIQTLGIIFINKEPSDELHQIIKFSINEEYKPIRLNALKFLTKLKTIALDLYPIILKIFNSEDTDELEQLTIIIDLITKDQNELFNLLSESGNYKVLSKIGIRNILISFFNSILSLETFRKLIESSNWEPMYKDPILNEIDIYQRILLQNF